MAELRVADRLRGIELSLIRQILNEAPRGAINLGFGEPDFATPEPIVAAARAALEEPRLGYTPNAGTPELRRAIARAYGPEWMGPESVCVTVGAEEALLVTMLAWAGPGDEVLVPDPGYPAFAPLVRFAGATPVAYPLSRENGFAIDVDALGPRITEKTRAVVVNTPANPTGRILPRRELEKLRELARARDLLVVSDEVYRELYFSEAPESVLDAGTDAVVVGSLSKSASMTGWRLGWAIASPERIERMTLVHQYAVTCAPAISQRAALAAFEPEARSVLPQWRDELRSRRDLLAGLVRERLGWNVLPPDGTFYMLVEAAPGKSSRELAFDLLARARVVTIPGEAFGREAKGFLRLSFSVAEDAMREAIDRLARAL